MNAPEEEELEETPEETKETPEAPEEEEDGDETPEPEIGANPEEDTEKVEESKLVKGFHQFISESYYYDSDYLSDDDWKETQEEEYEEDNDHNKEMHDEYGYCEDCGEPHDEFGSTCGCNM